MWILLHKHHRGMTLGLLMPFPPLMPESTVLLHPQPRGVIQFIGAFRPLLSQAVLSAPASGSVIFCPGPQKGFIP